MTSYNLTKRESRLRKKEALESELAALGDGTWPRDTNDVMRWTTSDRKRIRAIIAAEIEYLEKLPERIAAGELPGRDHE